MFREMSIEIIRKCPNHCLHCSSSSSANCSEVISFDLFKKVVDSVANLHLQTICFSGGEPFLHPDIVKMVKYVSSKGIQAYIYTSGIYMDQKSVRSSVPKEILLQLKDFVTKLIFNIEAATNKIYDRIMGTVGCFSYLRKTVSDAVAVGITCGAHFVPMKHNIDEIEKTLQFCQDIGISKVSFLRLVPHGRALINKESILLSDKEMEALKKRLLKIHEQRHYSIRIGVPLSDSLSEVHCEAAIGKLNVKYDGAVYPCEVFKNISNLSTVFGLPENIYDKDIEEIYYHSLYLNNIRNFISNFCQSGNCENCAGQFVIQELQEKDGGIDGKA